ncbi:hypothetical protein [Thiomicrorhabdus indica]|uniref:hypothetical protein n=1 Tax=Thiomicrorhabdus indica TaxID=2267253 RepID=UPI00102D888F|nr:hypothetical protein [Thiomicrorhabdus indica]
MPIACELYSQLELAAMRQTSILLYSNDTLVYQGKVIDLVCSQGEEYLVTPEKQNIPLKGANRIEFEQDSQS